jgi:sugar/nucleoside kinase (ribokinase family)
MSSAEDKTFDVIGLGCVAVDDMVYVPTYPAVDQKARITRSTRQCGGLTGTALVAAARLGGHCAFGGCLGTDWPSDYVAENFSREGVDTANAPRLPEGCVVHSTIVVGQDTGSRNIFYQISGLLGAHPTLPSDEVVRKARVVLIDDYGMEGNLRATRIARAAGVGVVCDFEVGSGAAFEEVLALVDHLVLSEAAAQRLGGSPDPAAAAKNLWNENRDSVVVTCGSEGCWSLAKDRLATPRHHPAFKIKTVDTTGCGDVFHGAYALALARKMNLDERIRFASAAAACKAATGSIATSTELENFLRSASH